MIARLNREQKLTDPLELGHGSTYTFTWEGSGHYHAQAYGRGADDEGWLERARHAAGPIHYVGKLPLDSAA